MKKKKKTPSPGEKGYIDWVNKKNKVPNYVSRGGEADTKNGGDDTSPTSVGQLMGGIVVFAILGFILFSIFNAIDNADPIDKVKGVLSDRNYKKESSVEKLYMKTRLKKNGLNQMNPKNFIYLLNTR